MESDARLARALSGGRGGDTSSRQFTEPIPPAPRSTGRGSTIILPDDFLRAPGWKDRAAMLADEQLAIMLQVRLDTSSITTAI